MTYTKVTKDNFNEMMKAYIAAFNCAPNNDEWKMKTLKQEIGSAEKVKNIIEEERAKVNIPKPTKERVTETSL